jgi:hypothetical protein
MAHETPAAEARGSIPSNATAAATTAPAFKNPRREIFFMKAELTTDCTDVTDIRRASIFTSVK